MVARTARLCGDVCPRELAKDLCLLWPKLAGRKHSRQAMCDADAPLCGQMFLLVAATKSQMCIAEGALARTALSRFRTSSRTRRGCASACPCPAGSVAPGGRCSACAGLSPSRLHRHGIALRRISTVPFELAIQIRDRGRCSCRAAKHEVRHASWESKSRYRQWAPTIGQQTDTLVDAHAHALGT